MSLDGGTDVGKRGKAGRSGGKPGRPRHYVLGEMKEEEEEELGDMLFRRELLARRLESLSAGGAGAVGGGGRKSTVPGRGPDVHWDYLLKEMQWMSADFQQERASHLRKRKKCAKAVVGYFKSMGSREERQAREEQEKRRRLAARIGREVKSFWRKVNQVVAFKQKLEVEEGRKRAMDKHLGFLLGQTERYSTMVAYLHTRMGRAREGPRPPGGCSGRTVGGKEGPMGALDGGCRPGRREAESLGA